MERRWKVLIVNSVAVFMAETAVSRHAELAQDPSVCVKDLTDVTID